MAEGKLEVTKAKKLVVKYLSKRGTDMSGQVPDGQLAADLARLASDRRTIDQLNGIEVEFELGGTILRSVRRKGTTWQPPQSVAPTQQRGPGGRPQQRQPPPPRDAGPPAFHNPYNFVPAVPRKTDHPELGDSEPPGRHRFHPDRISGVIAVKLTLETPLLLPDASRASESAKDHNSFPVQICSLGKPYLPPTAVKGLLRSAFEIVTNSRLAVFEGWDRRLGFRRQAKMEVEPARVVQAEEGLVEIHVLNKRWLRSPAKLPRYLQRSNDRRKGEDRAAVRYPDNQLPTHLDHVWVRVEPNGRVSAIRRHSDTPAGNDWHEGWVLLTEPNIGNKKSERVFVISREDEAIRCSGIEATRIHELWSDLIRDYQTIHERDLADRKKNKEEFHEYYGDTPGRTAWSRHVFDEKARRLTSGTLCYVRRQGNHIVGLYPVSISRDLYPQTPRQMLHDSLRPATKLSELSPAERVFGWANQDGHGACCGLVRVRPIKCESPDPIQDFGFPGIPLAILGQPKPQQSRFYVAQSATDGKAQTNGLSKEESGYAQGKGLRGRKVYPHHRALPEAHWTNPAEDRTQTPVAGQFQEYRRPRLGGREQTDSQNRSTQGWVKKGTHFTFDLHVTNLSKFELGGLLFLLTLTEGHFLRLGGGKPLGFGSVRLEIDRAKTRLHAGASWKEFYSTLEDTPLAEANGGEVIEAFKQAVAGAYGNNQTFEEVPFIKAFLRAARGFDDQLPIHYPRARQQPGPTGPVPPHPDGKAYEWFVANDRIGRDGGPGVCLPDLADDRGLPMLNK